MVDDGPIDIVLEFDGDVVLRVALLEVAEVGHAMEEGEVVDDGVEVEVVVLSVAGNLDISYSDGGVAAEDQDCLCLVGVFSQVLHYILHGHIHLANVLSFKVVLLSDEGKHALHVGLLLSVVNHTEGETVLSRTARNGIEGVIGRIGIDPSEVAFSPGLEDEEDEEDDEGTEVDEEVFGEVGANNQVVLS